MRLHLIPLPEQRVMVREHCRWLAGFDSRHLKSWTHLLHADPEAALCEACVRWLMEAHNHRVEPNADLDGMANSGAEKRPDFKCVSRLGHFYVEATCISIAKATEMTGLAHPYDRQSGPQNYGLLTEAVFDKAWDKSRQCASADAPTLLAVATFHKGASIHGFNRQCANELLTGRGSIRWMINTETGMAVGDAWHGTDLDYASFFKPADCSIRHARMSISGILLCGFGCKMPLVSGVLHPKAQNPFNALQLPGIAFGEVRIEFDSGRLVPRWPDDAISDSDFEQQQQVF
ncbi:MAG: hypothetical protein ACJ8C4_15110 [Gemmataceae bacterium]